MVKKRLTDVVYIDYLQNIYGKTLATAYSARASTFAGVSDPAHVGRGPRRAEERPRTPGLHDAEYFQAREGGRRPLGTTAHQHAG